VSTRDRLAVPLLVALFVAVPAYGQSPLSLPEAIARAKAANPDAGAAAAVERAAREHVTQARASYFPKIDLAESWQRGNHPVFVFSSLLAQRRFSAADFALDALNHPATTSSFRTAVSAELPLFDRSASTNIRVASIAQKMAATGRHLVDEDLTSAVTEAFGRVLVAASTVGSAAAIVESARADRELAGNRRDAGRATDADVLQLDVYLARSRQQLVQATSDERIARARLNQLMGEALDAMFALDATTPLTAIDITDSAELEAEGLQNRPEVALARQQAQLAAASLDAARAAFLPQIAAQGVWELNGAVWSSRASAWVAGAVVRINLFHGFADRARLAEAREQATRRAREKDKALTMARLDVQIAIAQLEAARATEAVGRTAVEQARESLRIIRDRYDSGLTDIAVLLRATDAVQQAEAQQIAARVNLLTATAALRRVIGRP
jgi:outer membrane protein